VHLPAQRHEVFSTEEVIEKLLEACVDVDFEIEGARTIVSEVIQLDDTEPFVIVIRYDGCFILETVSVEHPVWIRQLRYRIPTFEALIDRLHEISQRIPSP
jgi:hypothetical protein